MGIFYSQFLKLSKTTILCCPGPVQLHSSVKQALSQTQICHRDYAFEEMQTQTELNIRTIAKTSAHKVVFVTGSGTSANETVSVALGKLGKMLVISNGEFGERIYKLAALHHQDVDHISFAWGEEIDLRKIEKALKNAKYKSVAIVHHETSTGMLNPVAEIATLAHTNGAIVYVDAVSSLGAEKFEAEEWGIDIFVSSSGKALASIPGIGIVGIAKDLADRISRLQKTVQYLDLATYITYADQFNQTPNTPSVHALAALQVATDRICKMGLPEYRAMIRQRAEYVRSDLTRLGLNYFDYGLGKTSSVITCVKANGDISVVELLAYMRSRNIILYGGKGELENVIFQIGHIGDLSHRTMRYVLGTLKLYVRAHNGTEHNNTEKKSLISQEIHHVAR